MTSTVTPPCADATQAEQLGRYSSADRLHAACDGECRCWCHEKENER